MPNNRISLEMLRRSLGRVARDVERGGSVVVERRGEEVFALVPMRLYRFLEEERRVLVESTREAREAFSDLSGDEVEDVVAGELEAARGRTSRSTKRSPTDKALRVVVDANVCVSAVLSAKGSPARILDHALGEGPHDFELCAPSQLFAKVEEVLARPKIANRLRWSLS